MAFGANPAIFTKGRSFFSDVWLMSKEKLLKISYQIYKISVSVLLAVLALLMVISCVDLYRSGPSPFSRDSVNRILSWLAPFMGVVLLWIVAGFFLLPAADGREERLKGTSSVIKTLRTLSAKVDTELCSDETKRRLQKERVLRIVMVAVVALTYVIGGVVALIYTLDEAHFSAADPNREVLNGALTVLCCLILPFFLSVAALFINQASRKRELASVKAAIKEAAVQPKVDTVAVKNKKTCTACVFFENHRTHVLLIARIVVLVAGSALLVAGISNGGARDVVQKAIKICRECIGLG